MMHEEKERSQTVNAMMIGFGGGPCRARGTWCKSIWALSPSGSRGQCSVLHFSTNTSLNITNDILKQAEMI